MSSVSASGGVGDGGGVCSMDLSSHPLPGLFKDVVMCGVDERVDAGVGVRHRYCQIENNVVNLCDLDNKRTRKQQCDKTQQRISRPDRQHQDLTRANPMLRVRPHFVIGERLVSHDYNHQTISIKQVSVILVHAYR